MTTTFPSPPSLSGPVMPQQEVESTSPYPELGWSFMTASIHQMWHRMISKRDHKREYDFCLLLPSDTHPWNSAIIFWGSPCHTGKAVCRCSSHQPPLRCQATPTISCYPCGKQVFRSLQPPSFKPQQLMWSREEAVVHAGHFQNHRFVSTVHVACFKPLGFRVVCLYRSR